MKKILYAFVISLSLIYSCNKETKKIWLSDTGISNIEQGWGTPQKNLSVIGNKLTINDQSSANGMGLHSRCRIFVGLDGKVRSFHALAGVDAETGTRGSVEFILMADEEVIWKSGPLNGNDLAVPIDVNLKGKKKFAILISEGEDHSNAYDHADLLDAYFEYSGQAPATIPLYTDEKYLLTPATPSEPRINGPKVAGASAGKPFIFRIPATGERPMTFSAENLPDGLTLDKSSGIISGKITSDGEYIVSLTAENSLGKSSRELHIVTGKGLALTPTMGWNSWNCWGLEVDDAKVKAAADAFISTGLVNHGWAYINIDDGWEAPERAKNGEIVTNEKFPDMKGLTDYVHSLGLRMGIYSSPGPETCGGYLGSYMHEAQDANTYAKWGIDYLKYDWCSYGTVEKDTTITGYKRPYILMGDALEKTDRDIVFSLCQYGMADVWKWGKEVNGNLWRTTYDITDTWSSLSAIGFSQAPLAEYAGPGHWNDPDMLVVGKVGWSSNLHESRLTPDEQYTHISLWALLSAPLLIGCDLSDMDDFTLNLLTNDEVIEVNQDPLGYQARRVRDGSQQLWMKKMEDGTIVAGIFSVDIDGDPLSFFRWNDELPAEPFIIKWSELGIEGKYLVRDLWKQSDIGSFENEFSDMIPRHGVKLLKFTRAN